MRQTYCALLLALAGSLAWSQSPPPAAVKPEEVVRGTTATLTGTNLDGVQIRLLQTDKPCTTNDPAYGGTLISNVSDSHASATFLVPATVPLGEYTVCTFATGQTNGAKIPILSDSGHLRVLSDLKVPVKVTSVYQSVNYPAEDGTFAFTVLGEGFSPVGRDNQLLYEGRETPVCWKDDIAPCKDQSGSAVGTVVNPHQLEFSKIPARFAGTRSVQIRVGESTSDPPIRMTLAEISRWTPAGIAVLIFALLVALIGWLLGTSKSGYAVNERKKSLLTMLFLDQATDTYSLSKAQFYVWTAAAAFGYSYLTIARSVLQGHFDFAPVPDNLPSTLLISATAATAAVGLNNAKPKGAGPVQPSLADFITTGGLVAPERIQFLVWTVLGVLIFLFLILSSDPATLQQLPAIPDKFLYLMGISSAGYLGGRMARSAGPVIDDILASIAPLTLEIHGRNLSRDASFQVDGEDVKLDMLAPGPAQDRRPEVVASDDQAQDPNIAKILKVTIASPNSGWLTNKSDPAPDKRDHLFTVINPDGQRADWKYALPGPPVPRPAPPAGAGSG
jgi:hypothetical protein